MDKTELSTLSRVVAVYVKNLTIINDAESLRLATTSINFNKDIMFYSIIVNSNITKFSNV